MTIKNDPDADDDIPAMAVNALAAAQRRAMSSGREVIFVKGRQLFRLTPDGKRQVIGQVSGPVKVQETVKRLKQ